MKTRLLLSLLLLTLGTLRAEEVAKADARDDAGQILGAWRCISLSEGGEKHIAPNGARVIITREMLTLVRPGQDSTGMKYKLDPSTNPKQIDLIVELDPGHPIVQPGIYEIKGDHLRIHSAAAGMSRPEGFEDVKGEAGGVWDLERVAPGDTAKKSPASRN